MQISLKFILAISIAILPISAQAQWCIQLSDLNFQEHPFKMTKELPLIGNIRKQCGGTCWANAGTSSEEHRIYSSKGIKVTLSVEYIMTRIIRERFLDSVVSGPTKQLDQVAVSRMERRQGRSLSEAEVARLNVRNSVMPSANTGSPDLYIRLLHDHGSIPDSAFIKAKDTNWDDVASRLSIAMADYRSLFLKKPAETRGQLLDKVKNWIETFLKDNVGYAPETFKFESQDFTPMSFYQAYDPAAQRPITSYYAPRFKPSLTKLGSFYEAVQMEPRQMLETIKSAIDNGTAVYAGFEWSRKMLANEGILNIQEDRPSLGQATPIGGHAVVITGYSLNAEGQISSLKIQNSWGANRGRDGFFVIAPDEFVESIKYILR